MEFYYLDNKKYYKDDIKKMSLLELEELGVTIQESIQQFSLIRKKIHTFNCRRLNDINKKKLSNCETRMSVLYRMATFVSFVKKSKRDTMQKERDWYKEFFKHVSLFIKDKDLQNYQNEVSKKLGYKIELY